MRILIITIKVKAHFIKIIKTELGSKFSHKFILTTPKTVKIA